MKREITSIVTALIYVLLGIGVSYAILVGYLSNVVALSLEVSPPIFYASSEEIISGIVYKLLINEAPTTYDEVSFFDGNSIWFRTHALEITSFYPATYNFFIKAKASSQPTTLTTDLIILDLNGIPKQTICTEQVNITSTEYNVYQFSCTSDSLSLDSTDMLGWKFTGSVASITYYIMPDENTWIEVSPA